MDPVYQVFFRSYILWDKTSSCFGIVLIMLAQCKPFKDQGVKYPGQGSKAIEFLLLQLLAWKFLNKISICHWDESPASIKSKKQILSHLPVGELQSLGKPNTQKCFLMLLGQQGCCHSIQQPVQMHGSFELEQ